MDAWKIEQIPFDDMGNTHYQRVYGWGWLGPIGALAAIAGVIALISGVHIAKVWLITVIFTGFIAMWAGIFLNGFSERKSMILHNAKIIDLQINHIGTNMKRSADWAVRAVAEYEFQGQKYHATPMPGGYAAFMNEDSAKLFANYLLSSESIPLYIDPKRPKRTLFYDLNAGQPSKT